MTFLQKIEKLGITLEKGLKLSNSELEAMLIAMEEKEKASKAKAKPESLPNRANFNTRTVRLPLLLEDAVDKKARSSGTTLNAVVNSLLTEWVK